MLDDDGQSIQQTLAKFRQEKARLETELKRISKPNGRPREGYVQEWTEYHKQLEAIIKQIQALQERSENRTLKDPSIGHASMSADIFHDLFTRIDKLANDEEFARALDALTDAKRRAKHGEKNKSLKKKPRCAAPKPKQATRS